MTQRRASGRRHQQGDRIARRKRIGERCIEQRVDVRAGRPLVALAGVGCTLSLRQIGRFAVWFDRQCMTSSLRSTVSDVGRRRARDKVPGSTMCVLRDGRCAASSG